nr:hypothetical protein [Tanacetum cinerariifolium]
MYCSTTTSFSRQHTHHHYSTSQLFSTSPSTSPMTPPPFPAQMHLLSSNGQPSFVSTTSIPTPPPPTPPPPPPITRQRYSSLCQNPKQRVPYNHSANHATVLPTTITEPTSLTIANYSPEWRQDIKEEYDALMKNETWSLVPRASNTDVVDGSGYTGIDFHETFSPVVKSTTIRVVLSLAVTNNWPLCQLDVHNAFLYRNIKERVYMKQPLALLIRNDQIMGTIDNVISQLGSAFALKDLRPLNYSLGIEIVPRVSGILLSQKKYILELLQSFGLSNCNLVSSLMVTSISLSLDDSTAFSNLVICRQVVGSLQYVTLSRPDIAFAVNKVCQYMHASTKNHWSKVKWILRYPHGMLICHSSGSTLQAFTDMIWKGNPDTSLEAVSDAD